MSPLDIGIFQALATLFTLSFMAICYFILRFMRGLEAGHRELLSLAARFEQEWSPIVADLQAGAEDIRETAILARQGAEGIADLAARMGGLGALTKGKARGAWELFARVAGVFLK